MSKIRLIPVFNCELSNGARHTLLVHYTSSYRPIGIGDSKKLTNKAIQKCFDNPEGTIVRFTFSPEQDLNGSAFAGIKIICAEVECPFNKERR